MPRADGSGKCTLVATSHDAEAAFGVLYDVVDAEAATLARAEGVHTGGYVRRDLKLQMSAGRTASAMTYVASAGHVGVSRIPFDWYRDLVVAGAIEHGLPPRYVAIARRLTGTGLSTEQADAITDAVREAAEHGDHVTPEALRAELASLEARLTWRFAGAMLAQTLAILGGVLAMLRLLE